MWSALVQLPGGGGSGGGLTTIPIHIGSVNSSTVSTTLANGVTALQLREAQTDWISFSFRATVTGTYSVTYGYQMAAANGGDVELNIGSIQVAVGETSDATITQGTDFVVTPGNDVNYHELTSAADAGLSVTATAGDRVTFKLARTADAADTHTSHLYITDITVVGPA